MSSRTTQIGWSHNPKVAGSNPAPLLRKALETGPFALDCSVMFFTSASLGFRKQLDGALKLAVTIRKGRDPAASSLLFGSTFPRTL
jgi:hypothetical protein